MEAVVDSMDKEKLSWAADLLNDWSIPHAHEAAREYLSYALLFSPDTEVRAEARRLLDWAAESGIE